MGEQLHTEIQRCPATFSPADAPPQGAGKDPSEAPRGDGGWRVLAPVGCSATDPSCPSLSCSCQGLACPTAEGIARPRALPGQGTALVNPRPFSHHEGKKSPLQGCRGMEPAGRAGRRGLSPGSLFAARIQAFFFPPAQLCPSSKFTTNHMPGGGMLGALERGVPGMGSSRWGGGGEGAAGPRRRRLPPAFRQHQKGELVATSPTRAAAVPSGRWPSGTVLSASSPSAQAMSTSAWLTGTGSWRWR